MATSCGRSAGSAATRGSQSSALRHETGEPQPRAGPGMHGERTSALGRTRHKLAGVPSTQVVAACGRPNQSEPLLTEPKRRVHPCRVSSMWSARTSSMQHPGRPMP
eukprot:365540-Chlamydomonas_euryale.AAC.11